MPKLATYPMMIGDCPRCRADHTTFDVLAASMTDHLNDIYEVFVRCRQCYHPSTAEVWNRRNKQAPGEYEGEFIHPDFEFREWVVIVGSARKCPAHVPEDIQRIFDEAAKCEALGCWDAAGTMYRKVLDAATRSKTPLPVEGDANLPSWKVYKDLRLRLDWLFDRKMLEPSLRELSSCIHQDGNDAAHSVEGVGRDEATDLGDFAEVALRTIFTLPGQIAENQRRREARRTAQ